MTVSISGTGGVTFPDNSVQNTAPKVGMVNRIINSAMMIDQRNAGASVTPTDGQYTLDRWVAGLTQASKFTVQQSSTAPAGFINSLVATSSSAYSITSSDFFGISQKVEGLNVADLGWGTANAQTVTLSFWVRSSLTGTFGGSLINSAGNRSYPFSYTVSSANTWEQKTITVAGDTSGTWLTTNGVGVRLTFSIGMGSTFSGTAGAWAAAGYYSATGATSVVGTSGATFYITGVQLEKGSTATSFDYRPYGTELGLCQRYYEKSFSIEQAPVNNPSDKKGILYTGTVATNSYTPFPNVYFATRKRSAATVTFYNPFGGTAGRCCDINTTTNTYPVTVSQGAIGSTINDGGFAVSIENSSVSSNVGLGVHWSASSEL